MSKEQNVLECKECIKKLQKKLEENGFNILVINDDILVKTPRKLTLTTRTATSTTICNTKYSCPYNCSGFIDCGDKSCTCSGNCNVDHSKCPVCNGSVNEGNSSNSNNTSSDNGTCLFRIRPTDIYNGIFLHAITLHNEECDLKMTFGYDLNAVTQIINVLNFLI